MVRLKSSDTLKFSHGFVLSELNWSCFELKSWRVKDEMREIGIGLRKEGKQWFIIIVQAYNEVPFECNKNIVILKMIERGG